MYRTDKKFRKLFHKGERGRNDKGFYGLHVSLLSSLEVTNPRPTDKFGLVLSLRPDTTFDSEWSCENLGTCPS